VSEQPANPQDSEQVTASDAPAPLQPDDAPAALDAESPAEPEPRADGRVSGAPVAAEAAEAGTEVPPVAQAAAAAAREAAESPVPPGVGGAEFPPEPAREWSPPSGQGSSGPAALAQDKPEMAVGAAFTGGLLLALILKRLAR
jgi:hypothetical protein